MTTRSQYHRDRAQRTDQAAVAFLGASGGRVAVGLSSSYFRRRPYNWVRVSPSRSAALDLFQRVWAITCSIVRRSIASRFDLESRSIRSVGRSMCVGVMRPPSQRIDVEGLEEILGGRPDRAG